MSKKYVSKELSEQIHKKAEPFLKWLKEAEEESDEEDDSDGAIDLEFDERAKISTIKEVEENKQQTKLEEKFRKVGRPYRHIAVMSSHKYVVLSSLLENNPLSVLNPRSCLQSGQ